MKARYRGRGRPASYLQKPRRKVAPSGYRRAFADTQRVPRISNLTLPKRNPRRDEVSIWLRDAESEMDVAHTLLDKGSPKLYRTLLEALHDSVEKNMKAIIVHKGMRVPRGREGHDLFHLEKLLKGKGVEIPVEHREAFKNLVLVYPRTRYEEAGPLPLEFEDRGFLEDLLHQVEELNRWLKTKSG